MHSYTKDQVHPLLIILIAIVAIVAVVFYILQTTSNLNPRTQVASISKAQCSQLLSQLDSNEGINLFNSAKAAGNNWGGTVIGYTSPCVKDTLCESGTCQQCGISCRFCNSLTQTKCDQHSEVWFAPAAGSDFAFVCPPIGTVWDGSEPSVGSNVIGAGTQIMPICLGAD